MFCQIWGFSYVPATQAEFRPLLKVGTTFYSDMLTCLWEDTGGGMVPVMQKQVMPNSRVVMATRDPISRFVSAIGEVLSRVWNRKCPDGVCTKLGNAFDIVKLKSQLPRETVWYQHSEAIVQLTPGSDEYQQALVKLVSGFVHDTTCRNHYYASEHFWTQSGLAMQHSAPEAFTGEKWDSNHTLRIFHSEDTPRELFTNCQGDGKPTTDEARVMCESQLATYTTFLIKLGLATQQHGSTRVQQCIGKSNSNSATDKVVTQKYRIPTAAEISAVLDSNDQLMTALCTFYAQDYMRFSYSFPAQCRGLETVILAHVSPDDRPQDVSHLLRAESYPE